MNIFFTHSVVYVRYLQVDVRLCTRDRHGRILSRDYELLLGIKLYKVNWPTEVVSLVSDCYNMSDMWSCDTSIQSWTICSEDLLTAEEQHDCSTVSEVMSFKNTSALCGDLRFIVGLPEMCDVRFLVGHQRVSVYGVKAILSTRSR